MTNRDGKRSRSAVTTKGKGAGQSGMTNVQEGLIGENRVLSNRDKSRHSNARGQDTKWVQTEQLQDHAANRGRG